MLELFLTAFVKEADFERASAVLGGISEMSGWRAKHRVLFFNGPLPPKGFGVTRSIPVQQRSPYSAMWGEVNQALSKISYIVQARYEVFSDRDFAPAGATLPEVGAEPVDFNELKGIFRWTDFPKPQEKNVPITQRKKIEIWDQKNLVAILKDNNHRFKSEMIEESVSFFDNNVEYVLQRMYFLPPSSDVVLGPQPLAGRLLPPFEDLRRADPSGTWTLFVKVHVVEDGSPEKVREALAELQDVHKRLAGCFDFLSLDRKAHDTRMLQPLFNNMPAPLPQTQRLKQ